MLNLIRSSQFKRDVKIAEKRGKDINKLRTLLILLVEEKSLPTEYLAHPLKGTGVVIETRASNRIGC